MPTKAPKWRELADEIARQITTGEYSPGDLLPQVREMVGQGKGSTTTVHRAYQALEAEGLVRSSRGHGTRVLDAGEAPAALVTGAARLERLRRTGRPLAPRETYINSQSVLRSCADPEIANLLGVELYDEIVLRSRTFVHDAKPMVLALNVIHMRALIPLPELLDASPMPKFRHDLYTERTGKTITAGPEKSCARLASDNELEEFGIDVPPNVPVPVLVLRTVYSDDDGPLEVWEDILRPGMWHGGD
ncbi:GntR family transcriptional regulator (plasmid) [Streptomyces sp. NEAU-sy36]|uniref:GntR family transcriptional regulator n=1 Tax=unclassified Streptomyces TaxID=2593676 RepID=UPI0015D5C282|nr:MULTISPECIES: GntR family transcriptional regulator [unclassified Streptomyces]QLJ06683.1 GntR family transcriptional regulator [Streptomyces sp. NEAU-sy36]